MEMPNSHRSNTQRRGGLPNRRKPGCKSLCRLSVSSVGSAKGGKQIDRSQRNVNQEAPKCSAHRKRMVGSSGVPSSSRLDEGLCRRRRIWAQAADGLPGVAEGDMSKGNGRRKLGTTRGSPRRSRTAKASHISRPGETAVCPRVGRMGAISGDGPGQHNPDRSEAPWGRGRRALAWWRRTESLARHRTGQPGLTAGCAKDSGKPSGRDGMPGAGLTERTYGKALSEKPAFQPYRGKPAVRNDRGGGGNSGIIRSPKCASSLPDRGLGAIRTAKRRQEVREPCY